MANNQTSSPAELDGEASSPKPSVRFVTITAKNELQRVDNFLMSQLKGLPKSKIYRVIRKGEVRINKKRCKPEAKLALGDVVRIPPVYGVGQTTQGTHVSDSLSSLLDAAVLYEDDALLVLNKPSGLAVHGGSGIQQGLIEALRVKYSEHQFLELVHRLDRDTSGCILIAKSRPALRDLHAQFREDRVTKVYHLAVHGKWPKHLRKVDAPLRKNELKSGERIVTVSQDGKPSQTLFRILDSSEHFTLLEAKPVTGRTHQIRVHVAFNNCPIVGDQKYIQNHVPDQHGQEKSRLMLHARSIRFSLPGGKQLRIDAPYDNKYRSNLHAMGLNTELSVQ